MENNKTDKIECIGTIKNFKIIQEKEKKNNFEIEFTMKFENKYKDTVGNEILLLETNKDSGKDYNSFIGYTKDKNKPITFKAKYYYKESLENAYINARKIKVECQYDNNYKSNSSKDDKVNFEVDSIEVIN